jgi:hypothetical protein
MDQLNLINTNNPVNRDGNSFCGPLVVAAILGISTGEVAELIAARRRVNKGVRLASGKVKRVRGGRVAGHAIKGTYDSELFELLAERGYKVEEINVGARYGRVYTGWINPEGTRVMRRDPANALPYPPLDYNDWKPWTFLRRAFRVLWTSIPKFKSGTYIVNTPGHWAIASDGKWCETFTKGEWVPLALAPQSRRKVVRAWRVTRAGV